jgi:hypothetical protein
MTRLSEAGGVSPAQLARFVNGRRGLALDAVDKMCRALGLHLVKQRRPPAKEE